MSRVRNRLRSLVRKEKLKNESQLRRQLRNIIEGCPEGMTDDPPMPDGPVGGQMDLAPAPDLPDAHGHGGGIPCPIKTAAKMKDAGATESDLMNFVNTLIGEFTSGGTTMPDPEPSKLGHPDGPVQGEPGDLLSILGL